MGLNPKGRNWGPLVNWDSLGKFYASFTIIWTVTLTVGMTWLVRNRHLPFLKIRNIPVAIAATSVLHVYLVKILLAYIVNGHFSCTAEFWIMSIYLPFGIALFQANMVQLQSISGQQKKFLSGQQLLQRSEQPQRNVGLRGIWRRWCALTETKRAELLIAAGMVAQLIVTLGIYLASRKFHASWGSISHGHEKAPICRQGWEWVPSTFWQLVWAWFYGPYILWKIRNIKDVHYWRVQTTLCVVSGLPGTPLWLASVYSTAFKPVNKYWVPPMWLTPGIIMMQACTVFFPIYEAYRSRSHLRAIKKWETKKLKHESSGYSGSSKTDSTFSVRPSHNSTTTIASSRRKEMYTMAALEKSLSVNAIPLLQFAAMKEFTGENIVFLLQVRDWRRSWKHWHQNMNGAVIGQVKRHLFNLAVEIFAFSINPKTAEFPINIEHKIRSRLDAVFGAAVLDMRKDQFPDGNDNHVAPFLNHPGAGHIELKSPKPFDQEYSTSRYSESEHAPSESHRSQSQEMILPLPSTKGVDLGLQPDGSEPEPSAIPIAFNENVFDEAEASVKYMVLTNTWPKFVESNSRNSSHESIRIQV